MEPQRRGSFRRLTRSLSGTVMGAVIAGKSTDQFRPDFDPRRVLPPPPDVPEVEKSTPLLQGFYGHGQYATSDDMGTFRKSPIEDPLRKLESLQCIGI